MAIMQVSTESTRFEFLWKFSPAIEMCDVSNLEFIICLALIRCFGLLHKCLTLKIAD